MIAICRPRLRLATPTEQGLPQRNVEKVAPGASQNKKSLILLRALSDSIDSQATAQIETKR
jgi:hypothetical protein